MPTSPESLRTLDLIRTFASEQGLSCEDGSRPGEVVLVLPGEDKLQTTCSLICGGRMLSVSAFVIRNPDENHAAIYKYLLQRNLTMPTMSYAIDDSGDVYLTGQTPLASVDEAFLDQLLGIVLSGTDEIFNELLVLGFLSSMRREWDWRVSREQSLANLEPFRELLHKEEQEREGALTHEASAEEMADGVADQAGDAGTDLGGPTRA